MLKSRLRLACEQALLVGGYREESREWHASHETRNVELLYRLNNLQLHLNVRNKIESQF